MSGYFRTKMMLPRKQNPPAIHQGKTLSATETIYHSIKENKIMKAISRRRWDLSAPASMTGVDNC